MSPTRSPVPFGTICASWEVQAGSPYQPTPPTRDDLIRTQDDFLGDACCSVTVYVVSGDLSAASPAAGTESDIGHALAHNPRSRRRRSSSVGRTQCRGKLSTVTLAPVYPVRSRRLLLRPLSSADIDALLAYRSLPEVCRYVPFSPMGPADIMARLRAQWACRALAREGDALVLGAELADEGRLIGDVMLRWISAEHRSGEIGYVLNPVYGGRGLAAEAAHAVLHLAFDDLGLHRVVARVDARNTASARLPVRLGMRQEAHLIENEWFKGEWTDEVDFGLLGREWRSTAFAGCQACSCRQLTAPGKRTAPG
jgi:RimJ/RimL family protein N-acetyltransferase